MLCGSGQGKLYQFYKQGGWFKTTYDNYATYDDLGDSLSTKLQNDAPLQFRTEE